MAKALTKSADDQFTALLKRANGGDRSVLPKLRRLLDRYPELSQLFGDLGRCAKRGWIELATGNNVLVKETLLRHVAGLQEELEGPTPSALERLLAERVVVCWLELQCLDPALRGEEQMPLRVAEFYDRQRDRAHRRYLAAMRSLATVRRLVVPSVQVNIGAKQVNVSG